MASFSAWTTSGSWLSSFFTIKSVVYLTFLSSVASGQWNNFEAQDVGSRFLNIQVHVGPTADAEVLINCCAELLTLGLPFGQVLDVVHLDLGELTACAPCGFCGRECV